MKRIFPFRVPALNRAFTIFLLGPLLLWLFCLPTARNAHAAAPITPSGLNTQISEPLPTAGGKTQYDITGGTHAGPNLFHSFGQFDVPTNNIANFLNETGLPTSNILGRITGGNISNIFGTIQTTDFGSANLFLMNPAGFLFGSNATVNVGGMMTFTTSDSMRLSGLDGSNAGIFRADTAQTSILTSAPVAAFGFIGSNPHSIDFIGGQLTVASGTGLALVGGDISLTPDSSVVPNGPSSITAPGRAIQMTSVAGPGEVAADTGIPAAGMALGAVTLGQGTTLSTVGTLAYGDGSGGAVSIRGGQFVATDAKILSSPAIGSTGRSGEVSIATTGSAAITNLTIDTRSRSATGGGGAVSVAALDLTLQNSTIVTRVLPDTLTTGAGGTVTLTGAESVTLTQSLINTTTQSSNGNGGAVTVTSPIVKLEDSNILTGASAGNVSTLRTASGGSVALGGSETISVSMTRSSISTESSETEGNSGSVTITGQNIMIGGNGGQQTITTDTHSSSGDPNSGNGGDINITGTNVAFTDSAVVQSVADAAGAFSRGGNIRVNGSQSVLLDIGTVFSTSTVSQGNSGNIELTSQHVTITGQSAIGSDTFGLGGGGTITITGKQDIALKSGSQVTTSASPGSDGPAGNIELITPQLTIAGGSTVRSQSFIGSGSNAGTVAIQGIASPAQSVQIDGPGSGIFTNTEGTGAGGNIFVNANTVTLTNDATVSASSTGQIENPGDAGSINIGATNGFTMQNSTITTQAGQGASGGDIKVTTAPSATVLLENSRISASVADGQGGGGNIEIDPQYVILQNSQILAQAAQGQGGAITITTNLFLPDANSIVNADSGNPALNGTVTIQSPNAPGSGQVQPLGKSPLIATSLLNQPCAALAGGEFSSLTVAGRDSLPIEPSSWLTSPLATLNAGMGQGVKAEGVRPVVRDEEPEGETALLSLRQIAPAGFLTQAFAGDWSAGCSS